MRIKISKTDVTNLLTQCTWSGSRLNVSRTLEFTFLQDDRDTNIPVVDVDTGYTCYGYAEEDTTRGNTTTETALQSGNKKAEEPVFVGNIYKIERDRSKGTVRVTAHDHLHVLAHSKTTRLFTDVTPEDITKQICTELGVKPGDIATTGTPVSFVANRKTGYQIIMGAYNEASKIQSKNAGKDENGKDKEGPKYQPIMNGDKLDVIVKGSLIDGFVADSYANMMNSSYSESIENIVNQVMIVDSEGNQKSYIKDDADIKKHSMFQDVYKEDKNKDTQTEAKNLLKKPEREGTITVLGDYRVRSSYSIKVKDSLQNKVSAQFWVKADTHTFHDGEHEMKLVLEFENIMNKEDVEKKKDRES